MGKVSQDEFDKLPALIPLRVFMHFSGLSRCVIEDLRRSGQLQAWRPPGHRKAKYHKNDLARLCGFRTS